jgi:hypothetical protein
MSGEMSLPARIRRSWIRLVSQTLDAAGRITAHLDKQWTEVGIIDVEVIVIQQGKVC